MMTTGSSHLDESVLVRVLDGETDLPSVEAAHLAGCADCAGRLQLLQARSTRLDTLLATSAPAMPEPPPQLWARISVESRQRSRRWWQTGLARAAMFAGLTITGALVAQPSRDWILERLPGREPAADTVRTRTTDTAGNATRVGYVPRSETVLITIDNAQTTGTVTIRFEERTDATGEITTTDANAGLLVLPDGFRARNSAGDDWSFRFSVPLGLRVNVEVAGATVAEIEPAGAREVEIRLGER